MRLWKCYNHPELGTKGHDFAGEKPVCPLCKLDGELPEAAGAIAPRAVIHYDPPHPVLRMKGVNRMACQPDKRTGHGGSVATGAPLEVNCPACLATEAHKKAMAEVGTPEIYRIPAAPPAEPAAAAAE